MTWAPGPFVVRRRLGGELKRLREDRGLKLEDVARGLECSPSKISRLENGKGVPRWRDVRDMLDLYSVQDIADRDRLLEWSGTGASPRWFGAYSDILPPDFAEYLELEWDASRLHAHEAHVVHGLLQTREYARAVLEAAWGSAYDRRGYERLTEVRLRRQEALTVDHGLHFRCLLDESTLYRVVGSPKTQAGQLEHLVGLMAADHVEVRVVPFSAGPVPGSRESFAHLMFEVGMGEGLVYIERTAGSEYLVSPDEVRIFGERLSLLWDASLSESESVTLMKRALDRIRSI